MNLPDGKRQGGQVKSIWTVWNSRKPDKILENAFMVEWEKGENILSLMLGCFCSVENNPSTQYSAHIILGYGTLEAA